MEPSQLPQSNVAAAPSPGAALAAILESRDSITPLPLPCPSQSTAHAPSQLTEPAAIRLAFPTKALPVAVGPLLAAALDSRWQVYREQLRRGQEKFSEEAVPELRVATRRLLAQFTLLSCVAPCAALEKARRMLKRRLAALGDLRDAQVQRLFIEQKGGSFPEVVRLRGWLNRRERRLAMTADLNTRARSPRAPSQLASAVLRAAAQTFAEAVERRRAIDLADLRTVHQTRITFKRFRYIMESLSPGITGLSKRQLRALAYYQRKMGILQDLEVMQACVGRYTRGDKKRAARLQRFSRHLRLRRTRALRSFLKTADRLYEFWPPAALAARGNSIPTQNTV
jgi:CHAD domain-containing protein